MKWIVDNQLVIQIGALTKTLFSLLQIKWAHDIYAIIGYMLGIFYVKVWWTSETFYRKRNGFASVCLRIGLEYIYMQHV